MMIIIIIIIIILGGGGGTLSGSYGRYGHAVLGFSRSIYVYFLVPKVLTSALFYFYFRFWFP